MENVNEPFNFKRVIYCRDYSRSGKWFRQRAGFRLLLMFVSFLFCDLFQQPYPGQWLFYNIIKFWTVWTLIYKRETGYASRSEWFISLNSSIKFKVFFFFFLKIPKTICILFQNQFNRNVVTEWIPIWKKNIFNFRTSEQYISCDVFINLPTSIWIARVCAKPIN